MPESKPFRFLSHEEFSRLEQDAKAAYLLRAVQELGKMTASLTEAATKNQPEDKKK